jgi:hypothetical protein
VTFPPLRTLSGLRYLAPLLFTTSCRPYQNRNIHNQGAKKTPEEQEQSNLRETERAKFFACSVYSQVPPFQKPKIRPSVGLTIDTSELPGHKGDVSRKLRMEDPAAIYQVRNRSDQRKNIFRTNAGFELFLETLSGTCCKTDWHHLVNRICSNTEG